MLILLLSAFSGEELKEYFMDCVFEGITVPRKTSNTKKYKSASEFEEARKKYFKTEK